MADRVDADERYLRANQVKASARHRRDPPDDDLLVYQGSDRVRVISFGDGSSGCLSVEEFPVTPEDDPRQLLEDSAVHWRRDWDALLLGFIVGALTMWAIL